MDVDFAKPLLEEIMIQRERFEFLTSVEYENLEDFCDHCQAFGHCYSQCRLLNNKGRRMGRQESMQTQPRPQQHQEFRRRTDENARVQRNEVGSKEETEEQLYNAALNVILQSYDQVFVSKDQGNKWADQVEDAEDNESVSYVSATHCLKPPCNRDVMCLDQQGH